MAWTPFGEGINEEIENYDYLPFSKKSKNLLSTFVVFCVFLTVVLQEGLNLSDLTIYVSITYNLVLALFIYFNHRWAMLMFCIVFVIDKLVFIFAYQTSIIFQLIFGAVAVSLTMTAYKVATTLKSKKV